MSLFETIKWAPFLLIRPGWFFEEKGENAHWALALGFIMAAATLSSGASLLLTRPPYPWIAGSVLLINALGMVGISAGFAYLAIWLIRGEPIGYQKIFSVYAFAGSMPLLLSWVPGAFWITELWKWWLVGIGLVRSIRFPESQAALVIGSSIVLTLLFFWSLMMFI